MGPESNDGVLKRDRREKTQKHRGGGAAWRGRQSLERGSLQPGVRPRAPRQASNRTRPPARREGALRGFASSQVAHLTVCKAFFSIHSLPGPGREVFSHSVSLLSSTSCLRCSREQHEPQHRKDLAPWTGQRWVPSGAGTAVVTSVNLVLDQATEITRLTWGLTSWAPSPSGRGTVLASRITESTF